jgi:hypothetical protein
MPGFMDLTLSSDDEDDGRDPSSGKKRGLSPVSDMPLKRRKEDDGGQAAAASSSSSSQSNYSSCSTSAPFKDVHSHFSGYGKSTFVKTEANFRGFLKTYKSYWQPVYLMKGMEKVDYLSNTNSISYADIFSNEDYESNPLLEALCFGMLTEHDMLRKQEVFPDHMFNGEVPVTWLDHEEWQKATHPNWKYGLVRKVDSYGTHHTKMWLLVYQHGLRVVVMTGNLVGSNLNGMTDALVVQDFPLISSSKGNSSSSSVPKTENSYEAEMRHYLSSYLTLKAPNRGVESVIQSLSDGVSNHDIIQSIDNMIKRLDKYDFSDAQGELIFSVPGRHKRGKEPLLGQWALTKRLKLPDALPVRKALDGKWRPSYYRQLQAGAERGDDHAVVQKRRINTLSSAIKHPNLVMQVSAISAMGKNGAFYEELIRAFSAVPGEMMDPHGTGTVPDWARVHLMWPSKHMINNANIPECGCNLPTGQDTIMTDNASDYNSYQRAWAKWFSQTVHRYEGHVSGRHGLPPHHKSYYLYRELGELDDDGSNQRMTGLTDQTEGHLDVPATQLLYYYLTSANLSKAAHGVEEKKRTQLYIKSQEAGVLFQPHRVPLFVQNIADPDTGVVRPELVRRFSNTPSHPLLGVPASNRVRGDVIKVAAGDSSNSGKYNIAFFASQRPSVVDHDACGSTFIQVNFTVPYRQPSKDNRYNEEHASMPNDHGKNMPHFVNF